MSCSFLTLKSQLAIRIYIIEYQMTGPIFSFLNRESCERIVDTVDSIQSPTVADATKAIAFKHFASGGKRNN